MSDLTTDILNEPTGSNKDTPCTNSTAIPAERKALKAQDIPQWFAMRTNFIHADKFAEQLPLHLKECFVPPVIRNLLFIRSFRPKLEEYMQFNSLGTRLSFMWSKETRQPITVRDKDMDTFIRICELSDMPVILTEKPTVKLGSHVRITQGPLAGLEGNVVRIRKSKRVLVNIANTIWAATEFISPDMMEVIPDDNQCDNQANNKADNKTNYKAGNQCDSQAGQQGNHQSSDNAFKKK